MKAFTTHPSSSRSGAKAGAKPRWSVPPPGRSGREAIELPNIRLRTRTVGGSGTNGAGVARSELPPGHGQSPSPAPAPSPSPAPAPAPTPAPAAPAANPTLSLSGDSYTDSGNTSHKNITFDVAVPSGLNKNDYCLVNKLQGSIKKADGTFYKVKMYDNLVDFNFSSEQVDSVDADPVYWSNSSARWNYTSTSGGFSATDDPGPPGHSFAAGDVAAVKFHIGLYKLADVPTTTTGSISATAIQELPWQYSVKADSAGTITHPAL
jgi:hypothetical protein